jgi:hypothetical protein
LQGHATAIRPYISAKGKTFAAVIATIVQLVCQVLVLASLFMQIYIMSTAEGGIVDQAVANRSNVRHYTCMGLHVVASIVALVLLFIWVYQTHANLPALGAKHLDFSSGWAVGWFFVPIANLWKPYQALVEIWNSSDPRPLQGLAVTSSALIGWWWVLRVVSSMLERGLTRMARVFPDLDTVLGLSWAAVVLIILLDIPMLLLQIRLLRTIQRFQDERYELIEQQPAVGGTLGGNPFAG